MTTFNVDKNVSLPEKRNKMASFPFETMEINDSFLIPTEFMKAVTVATYVSRANTLFKGSQHFIYRKAEGGVRVWRNS